MSVAEEDVRITRLARFLFEYDAFGGDELGGPAATAWDDEDEDTREVYRKLVRPWLAAVDALEPPARAITKAEREMICDAVLAERQERFHRSFDIECPECGSPPGACCMNLGSAGGPVNHQSRIEAVRAEVEINER